MAWYRSGEQGVREWISAGGNSNAPEIEGCIGLSRRREAVHRVLARRTTNVVLKVHVLGTFRDYADEGFSISTEPDPQVVARTVGGGFVPRSCG